MAGKIVVATDGSVAGVHALDRAAELSKALGLDLCIVHVALHGRPSEELMRLAENEHLVPETPTGGGASDADPRFRMDEFSQNIRDGSRQAKAVDAMGRYVANGAAAAARAKGARNVSVDLRSGDYAEEILAVAREQDAEMIVIGRRGLGRIRETLMGSVSQKVLHHAPCTVVVVR